MVFLEGVGISETVDRQRRDARRWGAEFIEMAWRLDPSGSVRNPPARSPQRSSPRPRLIGGILDVILDWLLDPSPTTSTTSWPTLVDLHDLVYRAGRAQLAVPADRHRACEPGRSAMIRGRAPPSSNGPRPLPRPPRRGSRSAICAGSSAIRSRSSTSSRERYGPISASGPGPCAWPSSVIPTRPARAVRRPRPTVPVGPQVQRARLRRRRGVDDRVGRRGPQAAAVVGAGRVQPPAPQRVDPDDRRADRRRGRRLVAPLAGGRPASVDLYPVGRALVLDIVVRVAVRRAAWRSGPPRSASCSNGRRTTSSRPRVRQLPHPFPVTAAGAGARRPAGARRDHRRRDRRTAARHPTGDPLDVLETLVADGTLSDAEIRDQVVTLIGAGLRHDLGVAGVDAVVHRAHARGCGTACAPKPTPCFGPVGAAVGATTRRRSPASTWPTA